MQLRPPPQRSPSIQIFARWLLPRAVGLSDHNLVESTNFTVAAAAVMMMTVAES